MAAMMKLLAWLGMLASVGGAIVASVFALAAVAVIAAFATPPMMVGAKLIFLK